MFDIFSIASNYISSALVAAALLIIMAVVFIASEKWKSLFYTKKEFVSTFLFVLITVVVFLAMPTEEYYQYIRKGLVVIITLYCVFKIYGRNHAVFPKTIVLKKWKVIYKHKGKLIYKIVYGCLSMYERILVDLDEIKQSYEQEPYEAYCRLKEKDISIYNDDVQQEYYILMGMTLMTMGAYSEAKVLLENVMEKNPDNLKVTVALCVLYDQTGKVAKAREMAESSYQKVASGMNKVDAHLMAHIYHNYAAFLEKEHMPNKAIDLIREAVVIAFEQENLNLINMTLKSYFTLLFKYSQEENIAEYWMRYQQRLKGKKDTYLPFINMKLYLMSMGYPLGDELEYLIHIYKTNKDNYGAEGKCFLCLSCMNVGFGKGLDVNYFLEEMVELLKQESKKLKPMKRLRLYGGMEFLVESYDKMCEDKNYKVSPQFIVLKNMHEIYEKDRKKQEIDKMLIETSSIWTNQKCELRFMKNVMQRKMPYDFDKIYEGFLQIYKEREMAADIRAMLNIDLDIVKECESYPNWECIPEKVIDVRSSRKEIIIKHLKDMERLLDMIDYDATRIEYALRISRGYIFADMMDDARKHLKIFEESGVPETYLLEWEKQYLRILRGVLN